MSTGTLLLAVALALTSCDDGEEARLIEEKAELEASILQLEGKRKDLIDQRGALPSKDPEKEIEAVKGEIALLEERNDELEARVGTLEKEKGGLESQLKAYQEKYPIRN